MPLPNWFFHLTGGLPPNAETGRHDRCIIRLHDTHCYAYYLLHQLFEQFQIVGIVHTGGLSASIDMRHSKHLLLTYEEHLHNLAKICDKYHVEKLWIRPKDQDHIPSIKRMLPNSIIIEDCASIHIKEVQLSVVENELFIRSELEDYTRQVIDLWQFRQLMQGVKSKSQIELINMDQKSITSYALCF